MGTFPHGDVFPSTFVYKVMYGHNDFHVLGVRVPVFALHGFEKLLLAGVDPVLIGGCAWDGTNFSIGW